MIFWVVTILCLTVRLVFDFGRRVNVHLIKTIITDVIFLFFSGLAFTIS